VRTGDAEPLIKRSRAIREKLLPVNHCDVARSLSNLADLYQRESRCADASRRSRGLRAIVLPCRRTGAVGKALVGLH
jgi:hypothetical protein